MMRILQEDISSWGTSRLDMVRLSDEWKRADVDSNQLCATAVAIAELEAGLLAVIEKPLAPSAGAAKAIVRAAERAGKSALHHHWE